jgi:hypothetical protein
LKRDYDLVFVDELVMAPYGANLSVPRILGMQKIDYQHYWETGMARVWGDGKILDLVLSVKLRRFLARALRDGYSQFVLCSPNDEKVVRRINPVARTSIMPNGIDMSMFGGVLDQSQGTPPSEPELLYLGTMSYYPNVDAVWYFWHQIYPLITARMPRVRLSIVGHQPPVDIMRLQSSPDVNVTGSVPDVRPYLMRSSVMVVPLRLGGGTRLKILEAMASGLPVVSTTVGAQGLNVTHGENILLADEPEAFAACTVELLTNVDLYRRLATQGRALAANYDWSELVEKLLAGFHSSALAHPAHPVPV